MKYLLLILTFMVTTLSFSFAQEPILKSKAWYDGIYMGIGMNKVVGDIKDEEYKGPYFVSYKKLSHVKFSPNIFIGYNIFPYVSVEAMYLNGIEEEGYLYWVDSTVAGTIYHTYNKFIGFIVGKYAIKNLTPFIKLGIGNTIYKAVGIYDPIEGHDRTAGYSLYYKGISYHASLGSELNFTNNHALIFTYNYNYLKTNQEVNQENGKRFSDTPKKEITEQSIGIAYKYTFT